MVKDLQFRHLYDEDFSNYEIRIRQQASREKTNVS